MARVDERIRVVSTTHGDSIAALRNRGIAAARGELVAFQDSDDLWAPEKLEVQVAALRASRDARWCFSAARPIDADGAPQPVVGRELRPPRSGWILEHLLAQTTGLTVPSVMVERALVDEAGGFDEALRFGEDHDLWLRLAERAPCIGLDDELVSIRDHPAQTTRSSPAPSSAGMVEVFGRFARRTPSGRLRRIARRQQSRYAFLVALGWHRRGRRRDALAWLLRAVRYDPTGRGIALVMMPIVRRKLRRMRRG
jgi:glycosyltransferase involved in cell wall biosynthesis